MVKLFNLKKSLILVTTSLLFFACKKEDTPEVEYSGIIGTWESTSFSFRKISKKGELISDSVWNYLSPTDYIYTFNKDSTFVFIANTITPVNAKRTNGKGIYGIQDDMLSTGDGMMNLVTMKDGTNEFITFPYYLSANKLSTVVSANYADTSFNSEYVLNFKLKKIGK